MPPSHGTKDEARSIEHEGPAIKRSVPESSCAAGAGALGAHREDTEPLDDDEPRDDATECPAFAGVATCYTHSRNRVPALVDTVAGVPGSTLRLSLLPPLGYLAPTSQ